MIELVRGNKALLEIAIYDPDNGDSLLQNLDSITEARFIVKKNKTDLNAGAIIDKTNGLSLGVMLNASKSLKNSFVIPGIFIEVISYTSSYKEVIPLSFSSSMQTVRFGSGTPVNVAVGNRFQVLDERGNYVVLWVVQTVPNILPLVDTTSSVSCTNSIGSLVVRIDPDDTKQKDPQDYFFGLQLTYPWDIQEIDLGNEIFRLKLDTVTQN
jgi:hypothetical protein